MAKTTVNPNAPKLIAEYIRKQGDFSQEILERLYGIIMDAHPHIVEDWKWGAPNFAYKGLVCWLVRFKDFVGINFYKGALIKDEYNRFVEGKDADKGNRIMRFTSMEDINEEELRYYLQEAIRLNEEGIKVPKKEISADLPEDMTRALEANPKSKSFFDTLSPGAKRDYIEWITEAKREATRNSRMETMIEWLAEGKKRHWKYQKN